MYLGREREIFRSICSVVGLRVVVERPPCVWSGAYVFVSNIEAFAEMKRVLACTMATAVQGKHHARPGITAHLNERGSVRICSKLLCFASCDLPQDKGVLLIGR